MFRAEQMLDLAGPIVLEARGTRQRVVNRERAGAPRRRARRHRGPRRAPRERSWARSPRAASVELEGIGDRAATAATAEGYDGPDPQSVPGGTARDLGGPAREPGRDPAGRLDPAPGAGAGLRAGARPPPRLTAVVVHLRYGNPPAPDGPRSTSLADRQPERSPEMASRSTADPGRASRPGGTACEDADAQTGRDLRRRREDQSIAVVRRQTERQAS